MTSSSHSFHLEATESFRRTDEGGNHVSLHIEDRANSATVTLVLPDHNGAAANVEFLCRLADEAIALAAVVEARAGLVTA